jgi:hypothetical protein
MVVYTLSKDERIALNFVFERIYLRIDGSTSITVDLLLANLGEKSISRLRVALPYALVDVEKIKDSDLNAAPKKFPRFRQAQLKRVAITSELLRTPEHPSNWIYRTLPHAKLFDADGKVGVRRLEQSEGESHLTAPVKRFWRAHSPPIGEVDDWMWFLLTVNEITLFDLQAPPLDEPAPGEPNERLLGGESMWMRLELELPAAGVNAHSRLSRIVASSLEYYQRFSSPEVITDEIKRQITKYAIMDLQSHGKADLDQTILSSLTSAKRNSEAQLPHKQNPVGVKDWRIFLYREYGLDVKKIDIKPPFPCEPRSIPGPYFLPIEAYPRRSQLGWAPAPFYRSLKKRARIANCNEYWIGTEHGRCDVKGYSIGLSARTFNDWGLKLGFLALLVSVLHVLVHWWLFRGH